MIPKFWKLSQGTEYFKYEDISDSIDKGLVYVHTNTPAKGRSFEAQGKQFVTADIGDYFYLTHGNAGVYILGQFTGPANIFSAKGSGWVDRPFRVIRYSKSNVGYDGPDKWWAPNHRSTFVPVPNDELAEFESYILDSFFGITLKDYDVNTT